MSNIVPDEKVSWLAALRDLTKGVVRLHSGGLKPVADNNITQFFDQLWCVELVEAHGDNTLNKTV